MLGDPKELLKAKYERNGWPAQVRPDVKQVGAWTIELLSSMTRPRAHVPSPDGTKIAFYWDINDLSDLYVMPADGGWAQRLSFDRAPVAYWADGLPQWSPDGKWIAYSNKGHIWVISADGGKPHNVTESILSGSVPRWMPDSTGIVLTIMRDNKAYLVLTDRFGTFPRQLSTSDGHDHTVSISPDGKQIAYVYQPLDDFNRSDLMLIDVESGESRALTGTPRMHDGRPLWSRDGKQIAFISERPGYHEIFLIDPATGQERQLTRANHDISGMAWSPDSSKILCTLNDEGSFNLVMVDAKTGDIQTLRDDFGAHVRPAWLDSDNITFEFEDPLTPPDIYRMQLSSGAVNQLTFSKPPVFEILDQVVPERITYPSFDGMDIPAFLYRPQNPNGAAIVHPHGGPTSAYDAEWDGMVQYFVAKGYTWLANNFRGSTGYGIEFERANHNVWGVDDTKDCLWAADYLSGLDWIDADRIGIYGASYGSYMAVCALAYDDKNRFALGVAKYGDCNILSSWAQGDLIGREDLERMMSHPSKNRMAYRAGSPIWRADEIESPLFIAHGLLDKRVHPLQSEELVEGLKRYDKVFEYVTYANEGHGFLHRDTKIDFYSRLERFFDWYLL